MQNKKFPIKSSTACQFKWAWTTLYLSNAQTHSCHRVYGGKLTVDTFNDFHNTPEKILDREAMLNGEWPDNECNYCKRIEDAGGESERIAAINNFVDICPDELFEDNTATRVTPKILEVYFSNKCNQSCVYCSPMFSSMIQHEIEKFGPISKRYNLHGNWELPKEYQTYVDLLFTWLSKNSHKLVSFHYLGGEPLCQDEFERCVQFFESTYNPNLTFRIFTNLKHPALAFRKIIDRLRLLVTSKRLKSVYIICSIDAWGPEIEYARYGLRMTDWKSNFDYLSNTNNIEIAIHMTLSPITISGSTALVNLLKDASIEREEKFGKSFKINIGYNVIANPPFLDPSNFGYHLANYFDEFVDACGEDSGIAKGYATQVVNSPINLRMIAEMRDFLNELDLRRGTHWKIVYPWLNKLVNELVMNKSSDEFSEIETVWSKIDK